MGGAEVAINTSPKSEDLGSEFHHLSVSRTKASGNQVGQTRMTLEARGFSSGPTTYWFELWTVTALDNDHKPFWMRWLPLLGNRRNAISVSRKYNRSKIGLQCVIVQTSYNGLRLVSQVSRQRVAPNATRNVLE